MRLDVLANLQVTMSRPSDVGHQEGSNPGVGPGLRRPSVPADGARVGRHVEPRGFLAGDPVEPQRRPVPVLRHERIVVVGREPHLVPYQRDLVEGMRHLVIDALAQPHVVRALRDHREVPVGRVRVQVGQVLHQLILLPRDLLARALPVVGALGLQQQGDEEQLRLPRVLRHALRLLPQAVVVDESQVVLVDLPPDPRRGGLQDGAEDLLLAEDEALQVRKGSREVLVDENLRAAVRHRGPLRQQSRLRLEHVGGHSQEVAAWLTAPRGRDGHRLRLQQRRLWGCRRGRRQRLCWQRRWGWHRWDSGRRRRRRCRHCR
mmetsp:Transcript_96524/g.249588  ORF Transcript_96524/g.249588 Transcript_96524/m.249588 type:complete len:318 (-) Transcript_96524:198-1151(-)